MRARSLSVKYLAVATVGAFALAVVGDAGAWGRKSQPSESERVQAEIAARFEADKAELAERATRALAEGKSVMLVPLYGTTMRNTMPPFETGLDRPFSIDMTYFREGGSDVAGQRFNLALRESQIVAVWQGDNHQVYALQVVEPGTWHVTGARINVRDAKPPSVTVKREARDAGFGKVYFTIRDYPEQVTEQRWQAPTFQARDITADVCTAVMIPHGHCVQWGSVVVDSVNEVVSTGGWYDVVRTIQRPGLEVTVVPAQSLATVSVAAGEIVLLDGLYFKPPGFQFIDECAQTSGMTVACELNSVDYQVWPTDPALFAQGLAQNGARTYAESIELNMAAPPSLVALLAKAAYRPYALRGKAGWQDPQWGRNMYIEAGK